MTPGGTRSDILIDAEDRLLGRRGLRDLQRLAFLHTDGLLENKAVDGRHLKERELRTMVQGAESPEAMKRLILERVLLLWGNKALEDDCTFLSVQWMGEVLQDVV